MGEHGQARRVIAVLEGLLSSGAEQGLSLGQASRFFEVGERYLAYEELLHGPEAEVLATLRADEAAAFSSLDDWFDVKP